MEEVHPNPKEVGKRIREIRTKLGLSMEEFSSRIDEKAKSGTVSNWETGKNLPNNARIIRIAELGNVSMSYLLEGKKTLRDLSEKETQEIMEDFQIHIDTLTTTQMNDAKKSLSSIDFDKLSYSEILYLQRSLDFIKAYQGESVKFMFSFMTQLIRAYNDVTDSTKSVDEKKKSINFYMNDLKSEVEEMFITFENSLQDKLK